MGAIGSVLNSVVGFDTGSLFPLTASVDAQYASTDQLLVNNLYNSLNSYISGLSSYPQTLAALAADTIVQMALDDGPQPNQSLLNALQYLITQMNSAAQSVTRCTIAASAAPVSGNHGTANLVIGVFDSTGLYLENWFAETIAATVTNDAISGTARPGLETVSLQGNAAILDPFGPYYPQGSGVATALTCVGAQYYNQGMLGGNLLVNGDFEDFSLTSTQIPAGWTVATGTVGTTIIF